MKHFQTQDISKLDKRVRANLIHSLSGFKQAFLVATRLQVRRDQSGDHVIHRTYRIQSPASGFHHQTRFGATTYVRKHQGEPGFHIKPGF